MFLLNFLFYLIFRERKGVGGKDRETDRQMDVREKH